MKRILIILLIMLCIILPSASAERIAPTNDIGIFLDKTLFAQALRKQPLYSHLQDDQVQAYPSSFGADHIIYIEDLYLEDGAFIRLWVNKYEKIHSIRIFLTIEYLARNDHFEPAELLTMILKSTGLISSFPNELDIALTTLKDKNNFCWFNYCIVWDAGEYLTYDILSVNEYYGMTPAERTRTYTNCDPNYVGWCVQLTDEDLDCSYIDRTNFFVVGTDKHKLDGDGNGVCCEPYPK